MIYPIDRTVSVLSLGAGVQSSTLLMLYETGVIGPKPDFAIFADTKAEPEAVYRWLDFLNTQTSIPIYIFSKGDLREDYIITTKAGKEFNILPVYFKDENGKKRLGMRQCTNDRKLQVIYQGIRSVLGYKKHKKMRHKIDMQIGISVDEIQRMKDSRVPWVTNKYPLIDTLDWTRDHCKKYFDGLEWPRPPRSACYFCPFQNTEDWTNLKTNHPKDFEKACQFDDGLRDRNEYVHQTLVPLRDIDFAKKQTTGYDMNDECEGICGL